MTDLPPNWTWTRLADVGIWGSGGTPKADVAAFYGGDIPWAVIGDLADSLVTHTARSITREGLASSSAKLVPPGTILVAMYGSIGKLGIASRPMATNQAIAFVQPDLRLVDPGYLFLYLRSQRVPLARAGKGATQQNIGQQILRDWPLPLPPLAEQRRIVAALEGHLSRLDFADHAFARVVGRHGALIRSIHTFAVRGSGFGDVVQGRLFLNQLEQARLEIWLKAGPVAKYRSPAPPDLSVLPPCPSGWPIVSLEAITDPVRSIRYGILKPRVKDGGSVPYVEVKDLLGASLRGKVLHKTSPELDEAFAGARIQSGDVVMAVRGSYERSAVVPAELPFANMSRDVARIAPLPGVSAEYLHSYLQGSFAQNFFKRHARGVAVKGVNISTLRQLPVVLPPPDLQVGLVEQVLTQVAAAERLLVSTRRAERRASSLRSSLLADAFSGRLVQQDPKDESASDLLSRLKAERATAPVKRKVRSRQTQALQVHETRLVGDNYQQEALPL